MTRSRLSLAAAAVALVHAAPVAHAHQLNVFASTDCEIVLVEAKFSSGRVPVKGEVRISDGENTLLTRRELSKDGILRVPFSELDATSGLLIEVDTGDHDDYWILTPEDIARKCQS